MKNTISNTGFGYRFEKEIQARNKVHTLFNRLCGTFGSKPIEVPLVAPVNFFVGLPPRPLKEKDRHRLFMGHVPNGESVTVRYEGTVLTAAHIAQQSLEGVLPEISKYHYFQEMVRMEESSEMNEKRLRAFYQSGLEMFAIHSNDHQQNIVDTITFAVQYFSQLGQKFQVRISHIDVVQTQLRKMGLEKYDLKQIIELLEKYKAEELVTFMKKIGFDKKLGTILLEIAHAGVCPLSKGIALLSQYPEYYREVVGSLETLVQKLDADVLTNCSFDGGVSRSLDFYSGLTFQADLNEVGECMGGGEFTGLAGEFGAEQLIYGVGLAAGVERLIQASGI